MRNLSREAYPQYESVLLDYQIPLWKEGGNKDALIKRISLRDFFNSPQILTALGTQNWATTDLTLLGTRQHNLAGHSVTLNNGSYILAASVGFDVNGTTTMPNLLNDNALTQVMVTDAGTGEVKYRTISSITGNYFDKTIDDSDDVIEGLIHLFLTVIERAKLGFISVTQAIDLDQIAIDVGLNNLKVSNVSTNLSLGPISSTAMDVNSSDGTNVTLTAADGTFAGILTAVKYNEIVANTLKVSDINHNVTTNLAEGISTTTTVDVDSSDGTNATLLAASTLRAGLMSKGKFDEVGVNTLKVTFPEAPNDGNSYVRQSLGWVLAAGGATEAGTGTDALQQSGTASQATGNYSLAFMRGATATALQSIAIGRLATASASDGIAIGQSANVNTGTDAMAFGRLSVASNSRAMAFGLQANVSSYEGLAFGRGAAVSGTNYGIAMGARTAVTASSAMMFGGSNATRTNSTANSVEFNFDETTSTVRLAKSADSWFNTSANFAIGLNTGIGAKLHVKGVGATAGTKSLIVENSSGVDAITVLDDGNVGIGVNAATPPEALTVDGTLAFSYTSLGSSFHGIKRTGLVLEHYAVPTSTGTDVIHQFTGFGTTLMSMTQGGSIGIGIAAPTARVHIMGAGNTSATTSFLVENSGGTNMIEVKDDLSMGFYGATPVTRGASLTTQLTTITQAGSFTPDYAIQAVTNTTPYGFVSAAEAETLISTVLNLQTRLAELEARLDATTGNGLIT